MEAEAKKDHPAGGEIETTEVASGASDASLAEEPSAEAAAPAEPLAPASLLVSSRRGFLRGAIVAAGGAVAATVATTGGAWSYAPIRALAKVDPEPLGTATLAAAEGEAEALPGPIPEGWSEHDIAAREKVQRFVGNLAGPLGMASYLGEPVDDPEFTKVEHGNQPIEPSMDGDTKVFDLTVDAMDWKIDARMEPVKALGYNAMWPGPAMRVTEGDRVRVNFTNNLDETTGVHFHGLEPEDFHQDGIPFITQPPIIPGETFSYEFTARPIGSHMYHSHHNATEQVGRGLLGAFIVDPADPSERYDTKYGVTQEYIFIHNDMLGGFTINGHGFPATVPIVAKKGERVLIRYMNEGIWMHPWHTHGFRQRVVARDGSPLGSAEFYADTLGVNPGERFDTIVECDRVGVWAFHCHILTHVEGGNGMFGMVTALVVTE